MVRGTFRLNVLQFRPRLPLDPEADMRIVRLMTRRVACRETPLPSGFRWIAAACALLVLFLGVLAASPDLHARIHSDADHAEHACAVTLFNQGAENPVPVTVPVIKPDEVVERLVPAAPRWVESLVGRLQPSCGPPHC